MLFCLLYVQVQLLLNNLMYVFLRSFSKLLIFFLFLYKVSSLIIHKEFIQLHEAIYNFSGTTTRKQSELPLFLQYTNSLFFVSGADNPCVDRTFVGQTLYRCLGDFMKEAYVAKIEQRQIQPKKMCM